jgi:hypothetical protein
LIPGSIDGICVGFDWVRRINFKVIRTEVVNDPEVALRVPGGSVAALAFAPLEFWQRAMYADKEHVQRFECPHQLLELLVRLKNVIKHQVVARPSQGGQAAKVPLKQFGFHACPAEWAAGVASFRKHPCVKHQEIERELQKGFVNLCLHSSAKC